MRGSWWINTPAPPPLRWDDGGTHSTRSPVGTQDINPPLLTAVPAHECTPHLLPVFAVSLPHYLPSASEGHLKSLSTLFSSKTVSLCLQRILQMSCPPSFPSFQSSPSVLQTALAPPHLCSHLCCHSLSSLPLYISIELKALSSSTSSTKRSVNFPAPTCHHPSLACQSLSLLQEHQARHHVSLALSPPSPDQAVRPEFSLDTS